MGRRANAEHTEKLRWFSAHEANNWEPIPKKSPASRTKRNASTIQWLDSEKGPAGGQRGQVSVMNAPHSNLYSARGAHGRNSNHMEKLRYLSDSGSEKAAERTQRLRCEGAAVR